MSRSRVTQPFLVGDLLHDRDRQTLSTLHGAHELPRLEQVTYRTGIQPRIAPPHETHIQFLSTTIPIYQEDHMPRKDQNHFCISPHLF